MYKIVRQVGNSHVGADGTLTLGAAVDFIADFLCESCVALFCHHYIDFHHVNTLKTIQFN